MGRGTYDIRASSMPYDTRTQGRATDMMRRANRGIAGTSNATIVCSCSPGAEDGAHVQEFAAFDGRQPWGAIPETQEQSC